MLAKYWVTKSEKINKAKIKFFMFWQRFMARNVDALETTAKKHIKQVN